MYYDNNYVNIKELEGKRITNVEHDNYEIKFYTPNGVYKMFHVKDCCEHVYLEDVAGGKLEDLVGEVVLDAYDYTNTGNKGYETFTWTFYIIRTNKVSLTLRWYGSSNGYYSERVSIYYKEFKD
jgi:hypothetical protein